MESINFAKGYTKINTLEANPVPPPNQRRRAILAAASLAVLLTLILASLIAAVIYESVTESEVSESLETVCAVTRHPASCRASISPLNLQAPNNPLTFFNLSLHAGLLEVSTLKNQIAGQNADPAVRDCADLFDDAASLLQRSAELIRGEKVLTEAKIGELKTWISAAMTDQETCLDGLSEMGSTAPGEFRVRVERSQEYVSNTLAILSNIERLYKKFGLTMP